MAGKKKNVFDYIDEIHKEQEAWNDKFYKSANDKLLVLLGKCLEAYHMLAKDSVKVRKAFYAKLEELGYESKNSVHLTTKLVTYVFRIKGGRANAYARVLRAALDAKVAHDALGQWVQSKGGIEAVRRESAAGKNGVPTDKEIEQQTQRVLEGGNAIVTLDTLPESLHRNVNADHDFAVALVRHNSSTGKGEVVWGCNNATLVRAFFKAAGKDVLKQHASAKKAATAASKRKNIADGVNAAAAAAVTIDAGGEQKQAA